MPAPISKSFPSRKTKRRAKSLKPPFPKVSARELAYDLKTAALHECAHAVVASHLGYDGTALLFRKLELEPGERAVAGKYMTASMPKQRAAVVGWAGAIAEWIAGGNTDYDEFADNVPICPPSSTDYQCIAAVSKAARERTMKTAWGLVVKNWREIEQLAAKCQKRFRRNGFTCVVTISGRQEP